MDVYGVEVMYWIISYLRTNLKKSIKGNIDVCQK